ncbi:hypothetical protein [Streptomyces zagrosensis]|uniref:Uncharacterized protein n=1 Tax=Streptomyces zagrosensis TaxID=1042984 RepID=A0A7W9UYZ1_9ACTN|nr:hypothetical protein [Streptomyces zagrosensis]MBB5936465.1 hypothetical protein [Streptomyces zagrosensis]
MIDLSAMIRFTWSAMIRFTWQPRIADTGAPMLIAGDEVAIER